MLILPTFILLLLLVVDFGIYMYESVTVANAAREGARFGAVNCGTPAGCQALTSCTDPNLDVICRTVNRSSGILANADVTVGEPTASNCSTRAMRGCPVVVKVSHNYSMLFVPKTLKVKSCAIMQLERNDGGTVPAAPTAC
jgi:Flp pilus assembly protein TadG